ncbi:hypothetical protein ACWGKW_33740 [Streptomyces sp. NPDC054766]
MTGGPQEVIDKILTERELLGADRFMGQIDFSVSATSSTGTCTLAATGASCSLGTLAPGAGGDGRLVRVPVGK